MRCQQEQSHTGPIGDWHASGAARHVRIAADAHSPTTTLFTENRVPALPFIFFMRYYTGLPRLRILRKGRPRKPFDECDTDVPEEDRTKPAANNVGYVIEVCALNHGARGEVPVPIGGVYMSTFAARYKAYNEYIWVTQMAVWRLEGVSYVRE
jgi:hypothetical protein